MDTADIQVNATALASGVVLSARQVITHVQILLCGCFRRYYTYELGTYI